MTSATVVGSQVLETELKPPEFGQPWRLHIKLGARYRIFHLRAAKCRADAEKQAAVELDFFLRSQK